jgi:hypothetical protein
VRAGDFDFAIHCAIRFHWTPDQVDALPTDYADELRCAMQAIVKTEAKQAERGKGRRAGGEFSGGRDVDI